MIAAEVTCVVERGIPIKLAVWMMTAAVVCAAKPWMG
jgi:hypothetical protein